MKKRHLVLCIILLSGWLAAGDGVELPGHKSPTQVEVDPASKQLYVVEFPAVYIYSLEDFKLVRKFGEKGDGPGQFNRPNDNFAGIDIDVRPGEILAKARDVKIALFKSTGKFIREMKPGPVLLFKFHGEKFIGVKNTSEKGIWYWNLSIYNSKAGEEKKISSTPEWFQQALGDSEMRLLNGTYPCLLTADNKIFYCGGDRDFKVHVFDSAGTPLFVIRREYERTRLSEEYKKNVLNLFREQFKDRFEWAKKTLQFPVYYPAIRDIYGDGRTLYIRTFLEEKGKNDFFIYRTDGEFIKRVLLPIPPGTLKYSFPYSVERSLFALKEGKLYRLLKNETSKEFELHISAVDSY